MKIRYCGLFLALSVVLLSGCVSVPPSSDPLVVLQSRLNARLHAAKFDQAQWGVKVISQASGNTVFEFNSDKLMKPASNAKMYTAALALDRLGPDYRIKTSFYADAKPDAEGTIHGNLLVYGRGDPSFASRFYKDNYEKSLQRVVDAFKKAGIKRVDGDLIGDDSYFHGAPFGSEWTWDDLQESYGAPVSALMAEDDCLDLAFKPGKEKGQPCQIVTMPKSDIIHFINRTTTTATNLKADIQIYRPVGESNAYVWGHLPLGAKDDIEAVSVPNPPLWFVSLLKAKLATNGIAVTGGLQSVGWLEREVAPVDYSKMVEVVTVPSPPLAEIVKNTLKPSQNQYAQLLLLQVGAKFAKTNAAPGRPTEDDGLAVERKFLAEAGIKRGMTLLEEGSGLSRGALVTPSASVQLLAYMAKHRYHAAFYDGLPIAGVDGTLRKRFKGTLAAKNLRAKTGSLGHVNTLSGYMKTKGGDPVILSIMLNNYSPRGRRGTSGIAEIDALVNLLADYSGKLP